MNDSDNKTVLIPTGGGDDSLTGFSAAPEPSSFSKNSASLHAQRGSRDAVDHVVEGSNPILVLSAPLFRHLDRLLHTYEMGEVASVHGMLVEEIDTYMANASKLSLEPSAVQISQYILCTFLDELISTTYWGKEHNWSKNSLLSHFYHETYGGEKVFQVMNKLLAAPANHIHLLELIYVCISLGFEGKYRIQTRGKMELDTLRDNLYKQIRTVHGRHAQKFYTEQQASRQQHRLLYKASYPVIVASVAVMLVIIYTILTISLGEREEHLMASVDRAVERMYTFAPAGPPVEPLYGAVETVDPKLREVTNEEK